MGVHWNKMRTQPSPPEPAQDTPCGYPGRGRWSHKGKYMTTALIYDPIFLEHITPANHPDQPRRLEAAMRVLEMLDWLHRDGLVQLAPRAATEDELVTVHDREYIQEVKEAARIAAKEEAAGGRKTRFFATDTYVSAKSYETAIKAAGAPLTA